MPRFPPARGQSFGPLAHAASTAGWSRVCGLVRRLSPSVSPFRSKEFLFRGVLLAGFTGSWGPATAAVVVVADRGRGWPRGRPRDIIPAQFSIGGPHDYSPTAALGDDIPPIPTELRLQRTPARTDGIRRAPAQVLPGA